jgi:hypothetical protein
MRLLVVVPLLLSNASLELNPLGLDISAKDMR